MIGIVFAPIGGLLIWASSEVSAVACFQLHQVRLFLSDDNQLDDIKVKEISIDYSNCVNEAPIEPQTAQIPDRVKPTFKSNTKIEPYWSRGSYHHDNTLPRDGLFCSLYFEIPEDIGPPIFMYYRLTNFYQNHRKYVQSRDLMQMAGMNIPNASISSGQCSPLAIDKATNKAYYPCGLIANSQFNDTIKSPLLLQNDQVMNYSMTNKGIAWGSDKNLIKKTSYQNSEVLPPPNWRERYPDGYTDENPIPNLNEDEDHLVWMRTSGLPDFSKLSKRNDTTTMVRGLYRLDIEDRKPSDPFQSLRRQTAHGFLDFDVTEFGGTKSILISTRSVIGGKNPFLGIAYVVVGGICIVLGTLFAVAHLFRPR